MKNAALLIPFLLAMACSKPEPNTLFHKLDASEHGIDFQNTITENDSLNILTLEYIYNGGGVAVADFNNDSLSDLFFTGNMVANKLYLNTGDMRFKDVSDQANIGGEKKWKSAAAIADVNGDGFQDIYVCATISKDSALRQNMLFINKGVDKNGIPTFEEQAKQYGVNFSGHSSGAAFFDYDNDQDLDLYVMTNSMVRGIPTTYRTKINDGTMNADVLFRNNGDGTFSNVSKEAGILQEGYGLGLAVADINKDGWPDLYVSNDYISNDLLYINNKNGTFTNSIDQYLKHQSMFSMGNDVADFNNDALPDIITVDMLPEGNLRRKTVIGGSTYSSYLNNERFGYAHQYIRNCLQLNNGDGTFSDIGLLAGVHQTEWSWSPLFVDVDNDGWKDLLITNGFPRDITDKDFASFRAETRTIASVRDQMDSIPVVKVPNYAFKNNGDLTFSNATKQWGMDEPSFSNGAAFADLDNDGDLDYIINNINGGIFLYENRLYKGEVADTANHFLRIRLRGPKGNSSGIGAKVKLTFADGKIQYHDHSTSRGYISSVEEVVHFGTGKSSKVDSVLVQWPDAKRNLFTNVYADQVLTVEYSDAVSAEYLQQSGNPLMRGANKQTRIEFVHQEQDQIDFNVQRTLPHKFSQEGPALAVGDVNSDGQEDFYIGGAAGNAGKIFIQNSAGQFRSFDLPKSIKASEDQGALFFDVDNDKDLDLYVVSGSFEFPEDSDMHKDRLYINNGKGTFAEDHTRLPSTVSNGSCVRACDFDNDGDLDLFVGGKVIPAKYPFAAESYLLINESGKFINGTEAVAPILSNIGIVNDAIWTDINSDNKPDLLLAREFMSIAVFENHDGKLSQMENTGLEKFRGWWRSLSTADFDHDGDIDFVAGNLGLNNFYNASASMPLRVYAKDFDGNSSVDAILSCYILSENGKREEFPVHFWEELNSQSPKFRRQFKAYKKFGRATLDQVLSEQDRKDALVLTAEWMASSYIENLGKGKFKVTALPMEVQSAPLNGLITTDVDADGYQDIVMVGNDYGNEVNVGRYDAFSGGVLINNQNAKFEKLTFAQSGFNVTGDAKALAQLPYGSGLLLVASQNRDSIKTFETGIKFKTFFKPAADDRWAEVEHQDGKIEKIEFYYGSGYLSQSSRVVPVTSDVKSIKVYNVKGESRIVFGSSAKAVASVKP